MAEDHENNDFLDPLRALADHEPVSREASLAGEHDWSLCLCYQFKLEKLSLSIN